MSTDRLVLAAERGDDSEVHSVRRRISPPFFTFIHLFKPISTAFKSIFLRVAVLEVFNNAPLAFALAMITIDSELSFYTFKRP
jgi:hypothetical protein